MEKTVEIVILAMIAAFLGLRLYSVLGRRAEREEQAQPRLEPKADAPARPARPELAERGAVSAPPRVIVPGVTPATERGIREISAVDRNFDMLAFLEGAKGAYRIVLDAFWKGDREALAPLTDPHVHAAFVAAIDAREAAGEKLDNRLVRIEDAVIVAASYQAPLARVTVRFTADIAAVTRNAEGQVIAGSLHDAVVAQDIWTFVRDTRAQTPDWQLEETDEG